MMLTGSVINNKPCHRYSRYYRFQSVFLDDQITDIRKKCVFIHQGLPMLGPQFKGIWVIFTHLKLWVAVAGRYIDINNNYSETYFS